jgi:hypothetical protein
LILAVIITGKTALLGEINIVFKILSSAVRMLKIYNHFLNSKHQLHQAKQTTKQLPKIQNTSFLGLIQPNWHFL